MKFQILNRWSGEVQVEAEIECDAGASYGVKLGLAVRWAIKSGAVLSGADLSRAVLSDADLSGAVLSGAVLSDAVLSDADLSRAVLSDADLSGADLSGAVLSDADLSGAVLSDADLTPIRDDIWAVLSGAPAEAQAVADALREGRVEGSVYRGECACLVGTIANARHADIHSLGALQPSSERPAERFFLAIGKGDTPENSQPCALAHQWVTEWITAMRQAFGQVAP